MHYYQFNIGDYAKSTKHLTLLEDLAYRRLLDIYYDTEKPLTSNVKQLARIAGMSEYIDEITNVLSDFFTDTEEGFTQKKTAFEIEAYQAKAGTARVNGKLGGRPKKTQTEPKETQSVNFANPDETGLKPNYKPLTINQEPLTNNQELTLKDTGTKAKRFVPPTLDQIRSYCNERLNNVDANKFIDHYTSNGWLVGKNKMKDWKAAIRTWEKSSFDKPAIGKTQEIFNQLSEINYDRR
jgi:uncharacterized protein YdaU (DUF1376 family)